MKSVIEYNLPLLTAEEAAEKALAALTDVEKLGGDSLYYCIQASNVLALAGLRALSPYNEFHTDFSDQKVEELNNVLKKHSCRVLKQDEYGSAPDRRDFSIMNTEMLQNTSRCYPITASARLSPPKDPTWTTYSQWSVAMWIHYANLIDDGTLPAEWRQSWYVPHDIHFGMMLGYPGVALLDRTYRAAGELDRDTEMDIVTIEIDTLGLYDGSFVCYDVDKNHLEHPEIVQHSQLLKRTLEYVYAVYHDEKLKSVGGFIEEAAKFPLVGEEES